jgi:hypothetical protein
VPADAGARRVFRDENLLKATGSASGKGFGAGAKLAEDFRHIFRLRKAPAVEIVAPTEGNGPALAGESVKLKFAERQALDMTQQRVLLLGHEKVRLILRAFRKVGRSEEI